jgi:hypothetical protein
MSLLFFDENIECAGFGAYLIFFPAMESAGFPTTEFAVAKTLVFSCLGFLTSLFPRLLLPFDILISSNLKATGHRFQCS